MVGKNALYPALLAAQILVSAAFAGSGRVVLIESAPSDFHLPAIGDGSPFPLAERSETDPPQGLRKGTVRILQSGAGLVGGATVGIAGAGLMAFSFQCSDDPDVDTYGCGLAKGAMALIGGSAGYVIGTSLGVYLAGKALDCNGRLWAAFVGATAGFAAVLATALLDMNSDIWDPAGPRMLLTLTASNLLSVGAYAWSDRVRVEAGLTPDPALGQSSAFKSETGSMRTEVRFVLRL